jgi:hypothetical protein
VLPRTPPNGNVRRCTTFESAALIDSSAVPFCPPANQVTAALVRIAMVLPA